MSQGDYRDVLMINPGVESHNDGLDVSSAATLTIPAKATKLVIQALEQNVRMTLEGTTPTSTKGFQIKAADPMIVIPLGANTQIKLIEEAATADVQYMFAE